MNAPLLVKMSDAAFASLRHEVIPRSVRRKGLSLVSSDATEWIFIGYCERLVRANQALQEMCQRLNSNVTGSECWSRLTRGQRILYCSCALDIEVNNGGITQFLWNYSELIDETGESLRSLGETALAKGYDIVVETVKANPDLSRLKSQFDADPKDPQPFQTLFELLDLSWFDDEYLRQFGGPLRTRVIQYVEEHKHEFIEP